jgi:DNA-3-methyladenine glycosylase
VPSADPFALSRLLRETVPTTSDFFERPADLLAPALLGCVLMHGGAAGMIVEAEAYLGLTDIAAHASRGVTERTKVMFGPAGHAYVYLIYGMYECLNVVADKVGTPHCVLLRALEPLCGIAEMSERRNWMGAAKGLANGPGKLTQALGITRLQYGADFTKGSLTIRQWKKLPDFDIAITPRIGIKDNIDWPLRYIWAGHPCVSKRSLKGVNRL